MEYRIVTQRVDDSTMRFALDTEVFRGREQAFSYPLDRRGAAQIRGTGPGRRLVPSLLTIQGVTEVVMSAYALKVTIAEAFSWDQVEQKVCATLASVLQPERYTVARIGENAEILEAVSGRAPSGRMVRMRYRTKETCSRAGA